MTTASAAGSTSRPAPVALPPPRRLLEFTLDDEPVPVPEGAAILDACRAAGKDVPTLCQGDTQVRGRVRCAVAEHVRHLGRPARFPRADRRGARRAADRPGMRSACVYCGNCIEVCPTGALGFKSEFDMRAAGTWDEARQARTTTVRLLRRGLQSHPPCAGQ